MLMRFSYSATTKQFEESLLDLTGWLLDDSRTNIDGKTARCFYSKHDSHSEEKTTVLVSNERIVLDRNGSAEIPLFYFFDGNVVLVSDSVYELQSSVSQPLDLDASYQYLYSQFLPREKTLFKGVSQVLNSQKVTLSLSEKGVQATIDATIEDNFSLPMTEFEGKSEKELTLGLREKITQAHASRLSDSNAIFLSGGLDSQVMAIALSKDLSLGNSLASLHFSVKNARQSELEDAKLTAATLQLPFHAVEVDAEKEIDFSALLKMNAPYIGAVSIQQLLQSADLSENTTVFAGQDTRLHTPSLQPIDEKLLGLYRLPGFGLLASTVARLALTAKYTMNGEYESKRYRQLAFFAGAGSTNKYLANRFFHIAYLPFQKKAEITKLQASITEGLGNIGINNKRELFNTIALQLWRRQFIYDINYMHDTIGANNNKVAMPFYDTELAHYSAQLPFDLAAKMTRGRAGHGANEVSVNKYLLRKAYEGELDDSLVFRDKAVCLTAHMFFNGGLSRELENFINASWLLKNEAAQFLHLSELQDLCRRKHKKWLESDHWLMMTVFNALVIYNHLRAVT